MKHGSRRNKKQHISSVTFLQAVFLTISFFVSNDLISYAAACAFGFLFSFIPVVMMILVILIRFLHTNPAMLIEVLDIAPLTELFLNIDTVSQSIMQIKTVTNFEIIIAAVTIWLARRFFSSIMVSMRKIFNKPFRMQKRRTQVLIFVAEGVLTIIVAILIFAVNIFRQLLWLPLFEDIVTIHPGLLSSFADFIARLTPFLLIFCAATAVYKFASRTRPPTLYCMGMAGACSVGFWGLRRFMKLFINVNRYNLIYGVLSNVIVTLLGVYFFFMIFLFCAQFLFVLQFFGPLLLSELYLLPERGDTHIKQTVRRLLFIRPDSLLGDTPDTITLKKGEYVYRRGDFGTDTYYLAGGTIQLLRTNNVSFIERGKFFGEGACMLEETRSEDAIAYTDVKLVRIPEERFFSLLERNPEVAQRALSQISGYFSKFYGRNENYPL